MNAIILAHGKAWGTCDRHSVSWRSAFNWFDYVSPIDDVIDPSKAVGESCRNGQGAIDRIRFAVELASDEEMCCVMEYDTVFALKTPLPDTGWPEGLLCSCIFDNYQEEFGAAIYGHSPWITSGDNWRKILEHGDDPQGGWPDRWLAIAAQKAGIPLLGMTAGYSYDGEWTPEIIAEATKVRRAVYHGVKTPIAFEAVMR